MKPVLLIVRDGFGYDESPEGNAIAAANTPNFDRYDELYPWTLVDASGEAVGLPEGYQGSSEVGHMNMGAGRIVVQEMKRIDDALRYGDLYDTKRWKEFFANFKKPGNRLHLLGLLQNEGVHAHQEHLFKVMRQARKENPEGKIFIHPFLDGRDTPPRSTKKFISDLEKVMEEIGNCEIGVMMGRYYGMDRARNWKLTDQAYNAIVYGKGEQFENPYDAVKKAYDNLKTPDGEEMFDEYIPPRVKKGYEGVLEGDCVMHTNFRQDRAIQLSIAFVEDNYPGEIKRRENVHYIGFTKYYDEFKNFLFGELGGKDGITDLVGEVISAAGLRQLRITETQKFRHVTSFFNGKKTTPFKNEDQVEIKSRFDPSSFANHPEMEAYKITEKLIDYIKAEDYDFILVNYANCDMVGHTGNFDAAKKAVEILDETIGNLINEALKLDMRILLTSDHGNADEMLDPESGGTKTSHTLNPVKFYYIANDSKNAMLATDGNLGDIGATVIELLELDRPEVMSDNILVNFK
ncbi:MAG: 2,3-bisphosphoglycerate-independent phosphoglycerate mutase [Candidatus Zixiibacteriota bacterium]